MRRNIDTTPRSNCALSAFLDLFGDRWSLLVVRDLLIRDARAFNALLSSEEWIATNVLADRLRRLEAHGIVTRRPHASDARKGVYVISEKGAELAPVLNEMAFWAEKHDSLVDIAVGDHRGAQGNPLGLHPDGRNTPPSM